MLAEALLALQLVVLAYFLFFGFYNVVYSVASLFKPRLRRVKRLSGGKVAVVIVSYNEKRVLPDTIAACERLTYRNKAIIVADDSNDGETHPLLVRMARSRGATRLHDGAFIDHGKTEVHEAPGFAVFHRHHNAGFKAGSLKELEPYLKARGFDYMYLIDADWRPQSDALERCMEVIEANPKLAFVQTRCEYQTEHMPFLQRCIALKEEGAYFADLPGRQVLGDAMLFPGTCTLFGLQRMYRVGGFQPGHLTEDIDLTNRLYLAGYKGAYLEEVSNQGEVPHQYAAFRRQQDHWTIGTARTFKEYFWPILRSTKMSLREKVSLQRQNAYFTPSIAIEASILLAFASVLLLSSGTENFEGALYRYYAQQLGWPISILLALALASNFAPYLVTIFKRKDYSSIVFVPYSMWLAWSILHTHFIANLNGILDVLQDWYHTPKHNRKRLGVNVRENLHIRLANASTLAVLGTLYAMEYYLLGWIDPYAFFWVPALVIGTVLT